MRPRGLCEREEVPSQLTSPGPELRTHPAENELSQTKAQLQAVRVERDSLKEDLAEVRAAKRALDQVRWPAWGLVLGGPGGPWAAGETAAAALAA